MKRMIVLMMCAISICVVSAQDSISKRGRKVSPLPVKEDKFCAEMKGGKLLVRLNDHILTNDITLRNGNKITSTGMIIKKDGSNVILKNGECVNGDGNTYEKADSR